MHTSRRLLLLGATALLGTALVVPAVSAGPQDAAQRAVDPPETPRRVITGDATVHDPAIARTRTAWYVFSTGIEDPDGSDPGQVQVRTSRNGRHWRSLGTVTPKVPAWVKEAVPGTKNIWAPDISHHDGRWYLYYSASTFGKNNSVIGLMTNRTLDPNSARYHWIDRGLVTRSTTADNYNAIDPSLVVDAQGSAWLTFGSFWSGIKIIPIDLPSGKPPTPTATPVSLVDRHYDVNAVEAPYIVGHRGWYYLFAAFDFCCRGVNSTYRTVVGRSRSITGPYLDRTGTSMLAGGSSPFLDAQGSMRGPGGLSVWHRTAAFHYYDAANKGIQHLGLGQLIWQDGWPVLRRIRI